MKMRMYLAEFVGTMVLVFFGCGTTVILGGLSGGTGVGTLGGIALAFGLAIGASAYAIGLTLTFVHIIGIPSPAPL